MIVVGIIVACVCAYGVMGAVVGGLLYRWMMKDVSVTIGSRLNRELEDDSEHAAVVLGAAWPIALPLVIIVLVAWAFVKMGAKVAGR